MNHKKNVAECLLRCENLYCELMQVEEVMSDTMFKSVVPGGLRKKFDPIVNTQQFLGVDFDRLKTLLLNF